MGNAKTSGVAHHQIALLMMDSLRSLRRCLRADSLTVATLGPPDPVVNGSWRAWPSRNQERTSNSPPMTRPTALIVTPGVQTRIGFSTVVPANQEFWACGSQPTPQDATMM